MSRVSVIIPTFNRRQLLARAVDSVLRQEYGDLEVIVIDDCSDDGTWEMISSIADPRVTCLRHDANRGAAAARNTGIAAAKGEYLAFLDSDDEWMPEKVATYVKALRDAPAADGAVGAFLWVSPRYGTVERCPTPTSLLRPTILARSVPGAGSTLLARRHAVLAAGGFDEALPRYQDWDLMIRLSKDATIVIVDRPLHVIRSTELPDLRTVESAEDRFWRKHGAEVASQPFVTRRGTRCHHLLALVDLALARRELSPALRYFARAAWMHPVAAARSSRLLLSGLLHVARHQAVPLGRQPPESGKL